MTGVWIVLEGTEGTGTTTQMRIGNNIFVADKSHLVMLTREPTMGPYGKKIREILALGKKATKEEMFEYFVADRKWHVENVVEPNLNAGNIVLQDRHLFSTVVYQGMQGISVEEVMAAHDFLDRKPDLVLLFDADLETFVKRASTDQHKELFDTPEVIRDTGMRYRNLPKALPGYNYKIINADKSIEEVAQQCMEYIAPLLPFAYRKLKKK